MRAVRFTLDVLVPALISVVILSALLAHVYIQYLWVFDPG
jgi:hypothetical protein